MNAETFTTTICAIMGMYSLIVPAIVNTQGWFYTLFFKLVPFFGGLGLLYVALYRAGAF